MEFLFQFGLCLAVISLVGTFSIKGKRKLIAASLLAVGILLGIATYSNDIRQSQLNPSQTTEQSAGQQEQVAPTPVEEMPSTERMVWGGEKVVLAGDGEYLLPKGKKSLCITGLGMKDGSTLVPQDITIGGISYGTLGSKCQELPAELEGRVIVDFSPGKPWGTKEAIFNIYKEYDSKPGGIGQLPFIAIGM